MKEDRLDAQQAGAAAQFDRRSACYADNHPLAQTDDLRRALPYLRAEAGQSLLDVACGAGHAGAFFGGLGLRVTFLDLAPGMLSQAKARAQLAGFEAEFTEAPAEALPFGDNGFDHVVCRVAAHHFSCPATFCMEVARVLKPGGDLLLIDGTVEDGYPEAEAWAHEVERLRDPTHRRLIRPRQWIHLLGHVGLPVRHWEIQPFQQPDLEWYFQTADTPEAHCERVRALVAEAPREARDLFRIERRADGRWTWWWQRLILVAAKPV